MHICKFCGKKFEKGNQLGGRGGAVRDHKKYNKK